MTPLFGWVGLLRRRERPRRRGVDLDDRLDRIDLALGRELPEGPSAPIFSSGSNATGSAVSIPPRYRERHLGRYSDTERRDLV